MKARVMGIVFGAYLTTANAAAAYPINRQQEYSCIPGSHVYSICPDSGYCSSQGAVTTCTQICPMWDEYETTSGWCEAIFACEYVECTFGN